MKIRRFKIARTCRFAEAIAVGEWHVLQLIAGTTRNEECTPKIVAVLNAAVAVANAKPDGVEKARAKLVKALQDVMPDENK